MQHNLRRLGEMHDYAVAKDNPDVRGWGVRTRDGRALGEVEELIVDPDVLKVRYLEVDLDREGLGLPDKRKVSIPVESAEIDRHRHTVVVDGFSPDAIAGLSDRGVSEPGYTRAGEYTAGTTASGTHDTRPQGEVVVGKHMETEHVSRPVIVEREQVHVERRPVAGGVQNRDVRMENGEIRIPITEEELIVEKRPVVKEEIVVSKDTVREVRHVEDEVRKERFDIRDERGHTISETDRSRTRER